MLGTLLYCLLILILLGLVSILYVLWINKRPLPDFPVVYVSLKETFQPTKSFLRESILEHQKQYPAGFVRKNALFSLAFLTDPNIVRQVFTEQNDKPEFGNTRPVITSKSLFSIQGDEWKERRRILAPYFRATAINPMISTFIRHVARLENILAGYKPDEKFDLKNLMVNLTADVLGETAMGSEFGCLTDDKKTINKMLDSWIQATVNLRFLVLLPSWDYLPLPPARKFVTSQKNIVELCEKIITVRKNSKTKHNDLLQAVIDVDIPDRTKIAEVLLFLVAGHETTATLLSWTLFFVSQHPDVEQKIVEEIKQQLNDELPNPDNIHKLKYIECVINETLRLQPPALIAQRSPQNDITIGNVFIPKNSPVSVGIFGIHRNEKYWNEPDKFDPNRFSEENKDKIIPGTFIPFSYGPRMCIGWKFSMYEATVAIAMLYKKFTFQCLEKNPTVGKVGLLNRIVGELPFTCKLRAASGNSSESS